MDDGEEPQLINPDVQVTQSVNIVPGIQHNLGRIANARLARNAALPIVHILSDLCNLDSLDEIFQEEWEGVLEGEFEKWACNRRWRRDIEWEDIFAAKRALMRLMDRRGMLLKVMGTDPLFVKQDAVEARLRQGKLGRGQGAPEFDLELEAGDDE